MSERKSPGPIVIPVAATGHSAFHRAASGLRYQPIDEDGTFALIGQVVVLSAYVDRMLDRIIWRLLGLADAAGAAATNRLVGANQRFIMILKLGRRLAWPAELIAAVERAQARAEGLSERRARSWTDQASAPNRQPRRSGSRFSPKLSSTPLPSDRAGSNSAS